MVLQPHQPAQEPDLLWRQPAQHGPGAGPALGPADVHSGGGGHPSQRHCPPRPEGSGSERRVARGGGGWAVRQQGAAGPDERDPGHGGVGRRGVRAERERTAAHPQAQDVVWTRG